MPLSPRYVHTTHMGVMSPSWVLAFAFGHEQESLGCVSLHSFYQERERRSPVLSSNLIISCPSSHSITTQTNVESYLFHLYNSFVYTASPSCQPFLVSPRRTTSTWHCFLDSHHKRNQLMIVMLESVNPVSADSIDDTLLPSVPWQWEHDTCSILRCIRRYLRLTQINLHVTTVMEK